MLLIIQIKSDIFYYYLNNLINLMSEDLKGYKICINLAISNAKRRIKLLDKIDGECIIQEYKEWIKDGYNYESVLLLREDPII
tara:strand:+ start:396 stop:644 length:249 start_codon:yes stop_codon:yes gene_type:complete